jgi:hypothetical protein
MIEENGFHVQASAVDAIRIHVSNTQPPPRAARPPAVVVRMSDNERQQLEQLAAHEGLTLASTVRRLIKLAHRTTFGA